MATKRIKAVAALAAGTIASAGLGAVEPAGAQPAPCSLSVSFGSVPGGVQVNIAQGCPTPGYVFTRVNGRVDGTVVRSVTRRTYSGFNSSQTFFPCPSGKTLELSYTVAITTATYDLLQSDTALITCPSDIL